MSVTVALPATLSKGNGCSLATSVAIELLIGASPNFSTLSFLARASFFQTLLLVPPPSFVCCCGHVAPLRALAVSPSTYKWHEAFDASSLFPLIAS